MKGAQTVLVSDIHRIRPYAYRHRHKLHVKYPGWKYCGEENHGDAEAGGGRRGGGREKNIM